MRRQERECSNRSEHPALCWKREMRRQERECSNRSDNPFGQSCYLLLGRKSRFLILPSRVSDVGSIPIARSISLDDLIAFMRLSR